MRAKDFIPANKPRNFVAKNAMKTTSGAGAHRDKKKEQKQGYEKHKGKDVSESDVLEYETHRYKDDQGNEWEVNDEGERTLLRAAPGGGYGGGSRYGSRYPRRPAYNKPKGYWFFNVPSGKEQEAKNLGLMQTKSGKWYSTYSNPEAQKVFGKGRWWEPKN